MLRQIARQSGGHYVQQANWSKLALDTSFFDSAKAPTVSWSHGGNPLRILSHNAHGLLVSGWVDTTGALPALRIGSAPAIPLAISPLSSLSIKTGPKTVQGVSAMAASAEMAALFERMRTLGESSALRKRIIGLSQRYRVASEYTAFLVTETDADYDRPTSGRVWQRQVGRMGDRVPTVSFQSTPEPHEWALILLAMLIVVGTQRCRQQPVEHGRRR